MKRLAAVLALTLAASLLAGAYGVLHDQATFTISPEYFTAFKYHQFRLADSPLPDRVKVGVIGFLATWWMGAFIAPILALAGGFFRDAATLWRETLRTILLVLAITLAFGVFAGGYGWVRTRALDPADYAGWYFPENLRRPARFAWVGWIHNFGYLGGFIGAAFGVVRQVARGYRSRGALAG
ncbi:MAG: hypothetical protein H7A53_01680 [Akkermansiaceae bacterium]|nr:hypothetical protein [Akkermansiaceae bacterium]MCP5549597.1 hypothetical protein [Akkermansiaceae bacterium]